MISREEKLAKRFGHTIHGKKAFKAAKSFLGGGAAEGAKAQRRAAGQARQVSAAQAARARRALTGGISQARQDLTPFLDITGQRGAAAQQAAIDAFNESPEQQFLREQGERAILRNQAAIGGLGGGNVRRELQREAIGLAQQDFANRVARLQSAGTALAGLSQARGAGLSNIELGQGVQQANLIGQQGAAQAGVERGRAATIRGGVSALGALLSDKNLKKDISDLSPEDCYNAVVDLPLKAWRYIDSVGKGDELHFGPMAQDAPDCIKGEGETLDLHDELMLIAGAIQHIHNMEAEHGA